MELNKFAQLPVVHNGRVKPIDTIARNSLLFFLEKQSFTYEGDRYYPTSWILTLFTQPQQADLFPVFRVDHPGLQEMLFLDDKTTSFSELQPHMEKLLYFSNQFSPIPKENRTAFQSEVIELVNKLSRYNQLKYTFFGFEAESYEQVVTTFRSLKHVAEQIKNETAVSEISDDEAKLIMLFKAFHNVQETHLFLPIPLHHDDWVSFGERLLMELSPNFTESDMATLYAMIFDGFKNKNVELFNGAASELLTLHKNGEANNAISQTRLEVFFNVLSPFYKASLLYGISLFVLILFFFRHHPLIYKTSYYLMNAAFLIHTFGLVSRMLIQGRPPVTNLYSSAIFVGWVAILLCIFLERLYKNNVGIFSSALIGMSTLIVAHNLSLSGDTLEMMQAVLDSNFWLATHVITITMGYSAAFVAGTIGIIYIMKGLFTRSMTPDKKREYGNMMIYTVYFALFFSFVGTVLGGIWADQSWGRFWGWDPKENGALLIVLWMAIIVHARLAGFRLERLMTLAVVGNIITSFSWFGVNLLGVGLHSYGFMEKGFMWLLFFILSQSIFVILGLLPQRYWNTEQGK